MTIIGAEVVVDMYNFEQSQNHFHHPPQSPSLPIHRGDPLSYRQLLLLRRLPCCWARNRMSISGKAKVMDGVPGLASENFTFYLPPPLDRRCSLKIGEEEGGGEGHCTYCPCEQGLSGGYDAMWLLEFLFGLTRGRKQLGFAIIQQSQRFLHDEERASNDASGRPADAKPPTDGDFALGFRRECTLLSGRRTHVQGSYQVLIICSVTTSILSRVPTQIIYCLVI